MGTDGRRVGRPLRLVLALAAMLVAALALSAPSYAAKGGDDKKPCPEQSPNGGSGSAPNCGNGNGGTKPGGGGGEEEPPETGPCAGAALQLVEGALLVCVFTTPNACPEGTALPLTADGAPGSICVLPAGAPAPPGGGGGEPPAPCAPAEVPVVGGQCLPSGPPGGGGGEPPAPCAPAEVPVVGGQCLPTEPPSGGGLPAPPDGLPAPPDGLPALCAPDGAPAPIAGQCLPVPGA
jgi:hypothetical protein